MKKAVTNDYQDNPESFAEKVKEAALKLIGDKDLWNNKFVITIEIVEEDQ